MAGADKFGNFFIARLPSDVNEEMEDNPTAAVAAQKYLVGAPFKLQTLINYHVGETITSLIKASSKSKKQKAKTKLFPFILLISLSLSLVIYLIGDDVCWRLRGPHLCHYNGRHWSIFAVCLQGGHRLLLSP